MELISEKFYKSISGGIAMITKEGQIMVTNETPLFINGFQFHSSGIIKSWRGAFDFNKDGSFFYDGSANKLITATKIEGGFIYSFQNSTNSNYYEF